MIFHSTSVFPPPCCLFSRGSITIPQEWFSCCFTVADSRTCWSAHLFRYACSWTGLQIHLNYYLPQN